MNQDDDHNPMNRQRPKEKILIVDDTPDNLDILLESLKGEYAVIAALNGEKALQLATKSPHPDLILLDIMMPVMDGYSVCEKLKQNPNTRDIPIIFLTALTDEGDELRGLRMGAVDYIHKPISMPLVQARVKSQLALQSARRQLKDQVIQLEEAAALKENVDHIMRHDLKNPLGTILGFSNFITRNAENLSEEQLKWIGMIHRAGLTMLDSINQSLDIFKMEQGTYQYHPDILPLRPLIEQISSDLKPLTDAFRTEIDISGDSPSIPIEKMSTYTLFANLLKNAVEAALPEEVIKVKIIETAEQVEVIINNQAEVASEIKDRFFEKLVTHGKRAGTGLGCYSARLITETMNGSISMQSRPQEGTTLTVRLPLPKDFTAK